MMRRKLIIGLLLSILALLLWFAYGYAKTQLATKDDQPSSSSIYLSISNPSPRIKAGETLPLAVLLNYSDGSTELLQEVTWQCDQDIVRIDENEILIALKPGRTLCEARWKWLRLDMKVQVTPAGPTANLLTLSFLDHLKRGDQDYREFSAWVDSAVAGKPGWGFNARDAVYMYYLAEDKKYLELAIDMVEKQVLSEEAAIASCVKNKDPNKRSAVDKCPNLRAAFNSYLRVADAIVPLAYTYAYGYELLSDSQKQRWEAYANQTIWNIWHHQQAEWGGVAYRWSGWAVGSPGNNYYYSFLAATTAWAIASQNEQWLSLVRDEKLPLVVDYFADFPGGGSREGTSYGASLRTLFDIYRMWNEATGEDFSAQLPHVKQTIDYWVHATTPTLDLMVPYGDQSRIAYPALYDYQESLVRSAVALNLGSDEAKRGRWWLDNNAVTVSKGSLYSTLYEQEPVASPPSDLLYQAKGAGQLFVRSSWDPDAAWLAVVAGLRDESHALQEQGNFTLFKHQWLAVTENIWSHSGINQGTHHHNILRFVKNGKTIPQGWRVEASMDYQQQGLNTLIKMQLGSAYKAPKLVQTWQREILFSPQHVRIHDRCEVASDVQDIWQLNTPDQPIVQADGSIKAGRLLIRPLQPVAPTIKVIDWRKLKPKEYKNGGYKLELTGGNCHYEVQLDILD